MSKKSYSEAVGELETVIKKIESEEIGIDQLGKEVKAAIKLIATCKGMLKASEEDLTKLLSEIS